MSRNLSLFLLTVGLMVGSFAPFKAFAVPGGLDPTFDVNGIVKVNLGFYPTILASQPDGCLVVAGESNSQKCMLARYLPNGALDSAFGTQGLVAFDFGVNTVLSTVLVLPSGKILAVGFGFDGILLARYLSDGTPDSSFGTYGVVQVPIENNVITNGPSLPALVLPDGKILVSVLTWEKYLYAGETYVIRLNEDGSNDLTFGVGGKADFAYNPNVTADDMVRYSVETILLLPGGKILLGGRAPYLVKLLSNGERDPAFGQNGQVSLSGFANKYAAQPDGKIVTFGIEGNSGAIKPWLSRINLDGTMDQTFGDQGKVVTSFGSGDDEPIYWGVTGDNRIFMVGMSTTQVDPSTYGRKVAIACYHPDGSPDETFGDGGKVLSDLLLYRYYTSDGQYHTPSISSYGTLKAALLQSDNRLIVAASSSFPFLARFVLDDSPTSESFNPEVDATVTDSQKSTDQSARRRVPYRKKNNAGSKPVTVDIDVRNNGTYLDSFVLKGSAGKRSVKIKYFNGQKDVTGEIVAGRYTTSPVAAEDAFSLTAKISSNKKLRSKTKMHFIFQARSKGDSSAVTSAAVSLVFRPRH